MGQNVRLGQVAKVFAHVDQHPEVSVAGVGENVQQHVVVEIEELQHFRGLLIRVGSVARTRAVFREFCRCRNGELKAVGGGDDSVVVGGTFGENCVLVGKMESRTSAADFMP